MRCAIRLTGLTKATRNAFARMPGLSSGQAAHTALRTSPALLAQASSAAAGLAAEPRQPIFDNKMFCYQVCFHVVLTLPSVCPPAAAPGLADHSVWLEPACSVKYCLKRPATFIILLALMVIKDLSSPSAVAVRADIEGHGLHHRGRVRQDA
jgi:hypothetical protein